MRLGERESLSKSKGMISVRVDIKVRYQETDQMSVVYHANYFTWFEVARIELLNRMDCPYRELEHEGYLLPVLDCEAKFLKPAHFDDQLIVRAAISGVPSARIKISYEVHRDDDLLCTGSTTHAFIDKTGKLTRPPQRFVSKVKLNT